MFVQISPSEADCNESLCSLAFAARVRGVELGPPRKQTDQGEIFKYKQLVGVKDRQLASFGRDWSVFLNSAKTGCQVALLVVGIRQV